jgi:hypothetical protein
MGLLRNILYNQGLEAVMFTPSLCRILHYVSHWLVLDSPIKQ